MCQAAPLYGLHYEEMGTGRGRGYRGIQLLGWKFNVTSLSGHLCFWSLGRVESPRYLYFLDRSRSWRILAIQGILRGAANISIHGHRAQVAFMNPTGTIEKQWVGPEIMSRSSRGAYFEGKLFPSEGLVETDYECAIAAPFSKVLILVLNMWIYWPSNQCK